MKSWHSVLEQEMPNLPGFNAGKSRQLERLEFQRGRQISHLNLTAHPGKVQKMNFPPVLSEMDSGGDPPLLKCCLLFSGLPWNPENSELSGSNWMGQKEAEWWRATSKDQVGVISNYGNGRRRRAAITGVWLVQTYGAGELITTFLEVR